MRYLVLLAYPFLFACVVQVLGRFNLETCRPDTTPDQCIKRNKNGTGYYPTDGFKASYAKTNCSTADDGHGASDFRLAMRAHLQQTISIGYYSGINHTLLGGVDWPVPDNPGVVRLCMTGLGTDIIYRNTCVNAVSDNTLPSYAGLRSTVRHRWLLPSTANRGLDLAQRNHTGRFAKEWCMGKKFWQGGG